MSAYNGRMEPDVIGEALVRRRQLLRVFSHVAAPLIALTFACFGVLLYLEKHPPVDEQLKDIVGVVLVIAFFGPFAAWMLVEFIHYHQAQRMERRLAERGVSCEAEIVQVSQTGGSINDQPQLELWLRIELPEQPPRVIAHCEVVEQLYMPRVQRGMRVPVLVEADRLGSVMLDKRAW
ncbi:MAG: hypothetical protein H6718_29775 [Polyangiaceae bacterium]|nr:hypothetical protein [Polyangiaceae bacterium]